MSQKKTHVEHTNTHTYTHHHTHTHTYVYIYILAGPVEISTERGAIILFSRNILFQYKYIHRTKVLEGIRKNVNIYTIPQQLKFLMPMMIQFYMI